MNLWEEKVAAHERCLEEVRLAALMQEPDGIAICKSVQHTHLGKAFSPRTTLFTVDSKVGEIGRCNDALYACLGSHADGVAERLSRSTLSSAFLRKVLGTCVGGPGAADGGEDTPELDDAAEAERRRKRPPPADGAGEYA